MPTIEADVKVEESLEALRAKSWRKLDTATIFRLLLTLSAPQMHSNFQTKVASEATSAEATSSSCEYNVEDLMAWPEPAFWMPTTDLSTTLDWSSLVAESEPLIWRT
ncbi:hypothetical protein N7490_001860 [Penicillium lividum]|nr:hypothetical protein N7490_001860 [Penicillium lividum]